MADGTVTFCYAGYEVTVSSDLTVTVEEITTNSSHIGTVAASN